MQFIIILIVSIISTLFSMGIMSVTNKKNKFLSKAGYVLIALGGPAFYFYLIFSMLTSAVKPGQGVLDGFGMGIANRISEFEDKIHFPIMLVFILAFFLGLMLIWLDNRKEIK
jgi:ABC-type uncharacterized transport system permease subunit